MMTRRATFEKFRDAFPQYMYKPDHVRTEHFDGSREIMQFFQAEIDPASKRYLSEDYWFCFSASTTVETPSGKRTIKNLVDTKYTGPVLSIENGNRVWRNVTSWWNRPNGKRNDPSSKKKWVTFNCENDNNRISKLVVTDDHRVGVIDDLFDGINTIKFIPAKDTTNKYLVRNIQKHENPLFSKDQLSFVIGTLLGDASIGNNGQLIIQHSDKQEEYINFKAEVFGGKVNGPVENVGFGKGSYKFVMHAPVNSHTKKLRELFYENGNKTIKNIINMIDEKALAFWYMDDGSLNNKKSVQLATYGFSLEDHELLKNMFNEKFGIEVIIDTRKLVYKGKGRNYHYLRMNFEDSSKFFELIYPYIIDGMKYKLPESFRNRNDSYDYKQVRFMDYSASFIKGIKYLPDHHSRLYDIEVEGTHNFFASGTLAHNCQKIQELNLKTFLCPWMRLQHTGTMTYGGSLVDLAQIGATPTADADQLKKNKKNKK